MLGTIGVEDGHGCPVPLQRLGMTVEPRLRVVLGDVRSVVGLGGDGAGGGSYG
jgi:hypothetical protein